MALLDIYGNYNRQMEEFNRLADAYNDIYYAGDYANLPERPVEPMKPREPTDTQTLGEVLPQELYASLFGRGTPDTLTNEAWSLQNISSPFMSSAPETAYDLGQVNRMNNPLYYAAPDLLTQGQQAFDPNTVMATQNPNY
jgi:hypothetical protein